MKRFTKNQVNFVLDIAGNKMDRLIVCKLTPVQLQLQVLTARISEFVWKENETRKLY